MKQLFRTVAMVRPDSRAIATTALYAKGFEAGAAGRLAGGGAIVGRGLGLGDVGRGVWRNGGGGGWEHSTGVTDGHQMGIFV